jgi:hypothetical protein
MDNTEDNIHEMYQKIQKQRAFDARKPPIEYLNEKTPDPGPIKDFGRQAFYSNGARWNYPSFQSRWFHVGNGLLTVPVGQTKILAQKIVPANHAGVLLGFTQFFSSCGGCDISDFINGITWGLRIDGEPVNDFPDFVGQFSLPFQPCQAWYPLKGGAQTLGTVSYSPGSSAGPIFDNIPLAQPPTILFQATNFLDVDVVLSGYLIGYTFPIDERDDEFANL